MFVTIKAKGVYDPNCVAGAAGYGYAIGSKGLMATLTGGGPATEAVGGSTESDAYAIWKGLEAADEADLLPPGARVRICTDSRELVAILLAIVPVSRVIGPDPIAMARRITPKIRDAQAVRAIFDIAQRRRLDVEFAIEATDPRTLERARDGMQLVRAGR